MLLWQRSAQPPTRLASGSFYHVQELSAHSGHRPLLTPDLPLTRKAWGTACAFVSPTERASFQATFPSPHQCSRASRPCPVFNISRILESPRYVKMPLWPWKGL